MALTFDGTLREEASDLLGHEANLASAEFWVALALLLVLLPYLGRLAAKHFFGKDGTMVGIGAVAIASVALTFAGYCMALTSLSAFVPANFETLVVSLATCTVVLLVASAASQILSMGFGPSLGLQVIFWNIVLVARVGNRFLTDLWTR